MKKTLLTTAIIATTLVSSAAVFAEATVTPAQTTVHWVGSIADVIPGDNIVITGVSGAAEIPTGDLNLETNGTFDSTEIGLETHDYDETTQTIGTEMVEATWTLQSVDYSWGENQVSNSVVEVFDTASATPTTALAIGVEIPSTKQMSLKVTNAIPLDISDITDTTASAKVNVTMTAAFPA
ncbi:hypothetical protein [Aliivibrio fischeri]|uniref:hypothetical protein n=1 Tax=Aliivibrio fischeri TaxID=668 RepID=UPI0012D8640A|nr:hypothetical protein [Aliivibrio fischeri]MUI52977.1 hypothetical protein [Aliivibrio fischeri]